VLVKIENNVLAAYTVCAECTQSSYQSADDL
jgi:hypothetical protein